MSKKIAFAVAGILLVASPLIVFAQTLGISDTCANNPTIACLQSEIEQLIQILDQLLALHNHSTSPSATIDVNSLLASTGGKDAALVTITGEASNVQEVTVALKGGNSSNALVANGNWSATIPSVFPGTYAVEVIDNDTGSNNNNTVLATGTLTVSDGGGPSCLLATDKPSYKFGDTIIFSWFGQDATYADFVTDTSGKDTLNLEAGKLLPSGSYSTNASVIGNPTVTLEVGAADGTRSTCSATVNIQPQACPVYTFPACNSGTYVPANTDSNGCTIPGHYMCPVNQSDSLVATDPTPVPYNIVAGGTTGVTVSAFNLQPSGENMNVQQMGLYLRGGQGSPQDVTRAYVYQGPTLVGTAIFTGGTFSNNCPPANSSLGAPLGGCYFATTTVSSLALQQNAQSNFTVKADIAPIGIAAPGTSGDQVVIGLSDAAAVGVNSGAIVQSGYAPDLVGVGIFKSYPAVALAPFPGTPGPLVNGQGTLLMRFSISASPAGPIGIGKLRFDIAQSAVNLSSFMLTAYTDSAYSQPAPGLTAGVAGTVSAIQQFADGGSGAGFTLAQPLEIPAGATYYFQFQANSVSNVGSQASVTTTLDGAGNVGNPIVGPLTNFGYRFIWSDNATTTSSFTTNDWTNGFGVLGLPQSGLSQTLTNVVSTQGGLTVSSAQQPPNSLAFQGETVPFTKFTITNPTPASLSVSGFIVHSFGLISSQAFHDIRLFNNTAGGYQGIPVVFDSSGQADIGGQTTLLPGASDTFTVMGDMATDLSAYAGQAAQVPLTGIDTSGTNTQIYGTLPVNGATQTINASLNACANPQVYGITCWTTPTQTQTTVTSISPTSGQNGTQVTITGTGFGSSNYINLVQLNHAYAIGSLIPSTNGGTTLSFPLAVPSNTPPGIYTVQVCNGGSTSNACSNSSVTFTVNAPQATTVSSVSPTSGTNGTQVTITGTGFGSVHNSVNLLGNNFKGGIGAPVSANGTTLSFPVITSGIPAGSYVLQVCNADNSITNPSCSSSNSSVTFTVIAPTANPTVTYVSNSGGSVTGSYANLPAGSLIVAINVTSNQPAPGVSASVSGSGTVTLSNLPAGSFYLKAQDASGNYLAQSVSFTSSGSTQPVTFTASPRSGAAPLAVGFSATGAPGTDLGSMVNFGDGTSGTLYPAPVCAGCNEYEAVGHTYVSAGTYTATLSNSSGTTLGTATITVSAATPPSNLTFSAWPNSGSVPLTTYFTISGAASASAYIVAFGDGSPIGSNWQPDTETAGVFDLSHVYTTTGTYTATLSSSGTPLETATVTVTGAGQNSGGFSSTSASPTANANLANALTGLQSALQALLQSLGR